MTISMVRNGVASALLAGAVVVLSAQTSSRPTPGSSAAQRARAGAASNSTKAVLPDPALLDGAKHPAEKKSEYGMLGEFEIPGDENARDGRVGGQSGQPNGQQQQNPEQQPGGGGGQPQVQQQQGGQAPTIAQQEGGGAGQEQLQIPQQQGGGGGQPVGQGDPNAKAEGRQVAGLQGENQGNSGSQGGQRPSQVSIGDQAMQIKPAANAPASVGGQQPAGQTQQMEKQIGSGGKGAVGNNSNRGSEKGRTIPAGL